MRLRYFREPGNRWTVSAGDDVSCGDAVASGVTIQHAAYAGRVTEVNDQRLDISVTDERQAPALTPLERPDGAALLERIHAAGIVGLGGAGFPTDRKLLAALRSNAAHIIVNAVECEPGISCDAAIAQTEPDTLNHGITALEDALGADVHIVHSDAVTWRWQGWTGHTVGTAQTPDGAERNVVATALGQILPKGMRPTDAGVLVVNVGTAHAIGRALLGWPLIGRMVTVERKNAWLAIGTPLSAVADETPVKVGGTLSGTRAAADDAVRKTTNAIHAFEERESAACINCGACDVVCPERLPVAQIVRLHGAEPAPRYRAEDCIECGLCSPVCPSHIDVLRAVSRAKQLATTASAAQSSAAAAQARYQAHAARLGQREKERASKRAARLSRRGQRADA